MERRGLIALTIVVLAAGVLVLAGIEVRRDISVENCDAVQERTSIQTKHEDGHCYMLQNGRWVRLW